MELPSTHLSFSLLHVLHFASLNLEMILILILLASACPEPPQSPSVNITATVPSVMSISVESMGNVNLLCIQTNQTSLCLSYQDINGCLRTMRIPQGKSRYIIYGTWDLAPE